MNFEVAGRTTAFIWGVVGVLAGIIIFFNGSNFGWPHMAAVGVLITGGFLATAVMWGITMGAIEKVGMEASRSGRTGKLKNSDVDLQAILSRLSDEQLEQLRDALGRGEEYVLSDDGELVRAPRR
jgi:hypothetical protein